VSVIVVIDLIVADFGLASFFGGTGGILAIGKSVGIIIDAI
jgi:hypothetical protein